MTARPDVTIDYLLDEPFAGTVRGLPWCHREIVRPRGLAGRARLFRSLARRYDVAFDLHGTPVAALLARVAARESVVGFAGKRTSRAYTIRVEDREADRHTVEVNLDLLEAVGIGRPERVLLETSRDEALTSRVKAALSGPGVMIHPGGRFPHKLWPAERFRVLADELTRCGYDVRVLLGPGERLPMALAKYSAIEGVPPHELGPVLRAFDLFIGNDSGPMHFAAAAGCRVVGIFGPSSIARWRPWSERAIAVSTPCRCGAGWTRACGHPESWCMADLAAEKVMAAAERLLDMGSSG